MKLRWNPPRPTISKATYAWLAPYAAPVHNGAILRNGGVIQARPWTDEAINDPQTDLEGSFAENYQRTHNLDEAFKDTAYYLAGRFEFMIRDPRWNWEGETVRQNGDTVTSPRDIVDTETLVNSQQEPEFE